jgi:tRNA (cytosine38-C5)-methyltransferase
MALEKAVALLNEACTDEFSRHEAGPITIECCAAMDHSDLCNAVYEHNFLSGRNSDEIASVSRKRPMKSVRIEQVTVQDLLKWKADLWMMSPPCQPHTRQHENQAKDILDARSDSFLHICRLLQNLEPFASKPAMLVLENVVGFESSQSCQMWIQQSLSKCNYAIAQFHLQPTQVGFPNDRPRYYCVAVRRDIVFRTRQREALIERYFPVLSSNNQHSTDSIISLSALSHESIHRSLEELNIPPEEKIKHDALPELFAYLDTNCVSVELRISECLLQQPSAWCLDIVTPFSRRTSCFTSAYGKYFKGTGSVLLVPTESIVDGSNDTYLQLHEKYKTGAPEDRHYDSKWAADLTISGYCLRYFSGDELARLFGFPENFSFPPNISVKQQWKLIGNSLNVHVAAKILELGLTVILQ